MSIVSNQLRRSFQKLAQIFQGTRGKYRHNARPIPELVVEKYHRAIWALDTLGPLGLVDRAALTEMWRYASFVAANADGPDGGRIAHDIITTLSEQCEKVLGAVEKDTQRPEWQKQRDFLVGSMRRVRRACAMQDIEHLHFYKKDAEMFNVDLQGHPRMQIGYHLWQGIVREMKDAITYVVFRDRPLSKQVEATVQAMRKIIRALEYADLEGFSFDPKQHAIHLSKEQEGEMMWVAIREEISRVVGVAEAMA